MAMVKNRDIANSLESSHESCKQTKPIAVVDIDDILSDFKEDNIEEQELHFQEENIKEQEPKFVEENVEEQETDFQGENIEKEKNQPASDKINKSSSPNKEKYSCVLCNKEFQNKSGRYNHIRLHHKVKLEFGKVHCLETGCLFSCTYTTVLQQHLANVHNIPMKYLNLEFDNYNEFEKWKHNFETGEVCRFVKKSGARVGDGGGKSMYLYCSRSGTFISQSKGARCKKLGSCKISAHCTALIKYFEERSGKVKVTVCSTHYGHNRDHRFLRLTKVQKRYIAEKMRSGMSRELVLDSLRSTFVNKLDRIHELSAKDLSNIQKSYKIPKQTSKTRKPAHPGCALLAPSNVMHDSWTSEIDVSVDSPILLSKDSLVEVAGMRKEDKCLVIMTKGQRDLFAKFCNNGVQYVSILRLSFSLPLFLIVVFILDDFNEMFPVCFTVANNHGRDILKTCFNQILNAIGPVVLRAFATDNQPFIFDVWNEVMGPATRSLTIANRYVDAEWRNHLSVIKDEALQGEIYDQLYEFIKNDDGTEDKFGALIAKLRASCMSSSFATYLEKNFADSVRLWSTHYLRELYDVREPIDFEISHSKVASVAELSCKYGKSVSCTAKNLIRLLLDLLALRNRRVAEHVAEAHVMHATSVQCGTESVFPLGDRSWKVLSPEGDTRRFYHVVADKCHFDECVLACGQCGVCRHAFRCTCQGYADAVACTHVHLVGSVVKNNVANSGCGARINHQMLRTVEDGNNPAAADVDNLAERSAELRPLQTETLRLMDEIGKKLIELRDKKSLSQVHKLVVEVSNNVDALLDYGGLAKTVEIAKTSKLTRKTRKVAERNVTPVIEKHVVARQKSAIAQKNCSTVSNKRSIAADKCLITPDKDPAPPNKRPTRGRPPKKA